jgi:hypothetical protein
VRSGQNLDRLGEIAVAGHRAQLTGVGTEHVGQHLLTVQLCRVVFPEMVAIHYVCCGPIARPTECLSCRLVSRYEGVRSTRLLTQSVGNEAAGGADVGMPRYLNMFCEVPLVVNASPYAPSARRGLQMMASAVGANRMDRRAPRDGSNLGSVIQTYMRARRISTNGEMAAVLGVDRTLVSKYISGARHCHDVTQLREFARVMDLPPETFGLLPEPYSAASDGSPTTDEAEEWRLVRQTLNRNRHELTKMVAGLYWGPERIEGTPCLTMPGWMPDGPRELSDVVLSWVDAPPAPKIVGSHEATAPYRPPGPGGVRYARYSQAVRALAKPSLFENRGSYRLMSLDLASSELGMEYGYTTYFDMLDVCEVLSHEVAAAWMRRPAGAGKLAMSDLPFREYVGDLFDLGRRPVLPSINTLTIRRAAGGDSILLHRRGSGQVAIAGGQSHVIPAGVFQPSGIAPWNMAGDFDLWRSMLREYSEEMLGNPEHDGSSGAPIDYDTEEPFRTLNEGRRAGKVRVWLLGAGMDPLVPAGEILTAVTIEADVFDRAFANMVAKNAEGELFPSEDGAIGIAWTSANVRRLQTREPLACSAAACIALTWKYRDTILGS